MAREFDYLIFIGRFQPFHKGHAGVVQAALERADRLIVLLGSAQQARTPKNPFTDDERRVMITQVMGENAPRLRLDTLCDRMYQPNRWLADVQEKVAAIVRADGLDPATARVGIVGREKDASSYYLRAFPQWPLLNVARTEMLSATDMRNHYLAGDDGGRLLLKANVPEAVYGMLEAFRRTSAYSQLAEERVVLNDYTARWANCPYPPVFVTVDAVVVHSGHVLLIERKLDPGRGLMALPGGFIKPRDTLMASVLRELKEETRLKLPRPVLQGSMRGTQVFDHPDRSLRGRTITHAFFFNIPEGPLPQVRAGDDAARAAWYPISEALAMRERFYEDHHAILEHFVNAH